MKILLYALFEGTYGKKLFALKKSSPPQTLQSEKPRASIDRKRLQNMFKAYDKA